MLFYFPQKSLAVTNLASLDAGSGTHSKRKDNFWREFWTWTTFFCWWLPFKILSFFVCVQRFNSHSPAGIMLLQAGDQSRFKQRCMGDPACVQQPPSPQTAAGELLPRHPSLRQPRRRVGSQRGGEERKYSQNWKRGGVGACRSTTFQSRITVSACVGLICGQTNTSRGLKPPSMWDVSWLPKQPC